MAGETVLNRFEQPTIDGNNKLILAGQSETPAGHNLKTKLVSVSIGDISSAGTVFIAPGVEGLIVRITAVIDAAINVADATLTFKVAGITMSGASITINNTASSAGDVVQSTPTALNFLLASEPIEIIKDGGSTTVSNGVVTFEILPS